MIKFWMTTEERNKELLRMDASELRLNADEMDRIANAYCDLAETMRKRADKLDHEKLQYLSNL